MQKIPGRNLSSLALSTDDPRGVYQCQPTASFWYGSLSKSTEVFVRGRITIIFPLLAKEKFI